MAFPADPELQCRPVCALRRCTNALAHSKASVYRRGIGVPDLNHRIAIAYRPGSAFLLRGNRKPNAGGQPMLIGELTAGTCALDDISKENLEPEGVAQSTDQLLPR